MKPVIDFHCHIYPDKIAEKAAASIGDFYHIEMDKDGRIASLVQEGKQAGITHFLVHSVATSPKQVISINNFISQTVAKYNDCMTGFGTLHPDSDDIAADTDHLVEVGLRGIKLHPDFQKFCLDSDKSMEIFENARRCALPVLIHTGDYRYDYSNPNRLIPVLDRFPDVTIIGAHFGGWSIWERATRELYTHENLLVDCSSSLYALTSEKAGELIRLYGSKRVLFGTDYPMWDAKDELERFNKIELSENERRDILYNNAARLLGMEQDV